MSSKVIVQQGVVTNGNSQVARRNSVRNGGSRTRRPPMTYTPSKLSSDYALDMSKAAKKKIAATERGKDVEVNLKYNNLVMVFTPASYELFRKGISGYFSMYKDNDVKSTLKRDTEGATVHESLAISDRANGKKMFTVNLFHATRKVTVNGSQLRLFLEEDLDCILNKINQNGSLDYINSQLKDVCHRYLLKNPSKSSTKGATRRSLDSTDSNGHKNSLISPPKKLKLFEDSSVTVDLTETETLRADANSLSCKETICEGNDECCPVCDTVVTDEQQGLFCESCSMWYHASCCGVDEAGYQELNDNEDSEFRCTNCVIVDDMTLDEALQGTEGLDRSQIEKSSREGIEDVIVVNHEPDNNLNAVDLTSVGKEKKSELSKSEDEIAYM